MKCFRRRSSCHHIECLLSLESLPKQRQMQSMGPPSSFSPEDPFPLSTMSYPSTPVAIQCCKDPGYKEGLEYQRRKKTIQDGQTILNEEQSCHFLNAPFNQVNIATDKREHGDKPSQPSADEEEVKVIFEDIKVECINIEESEEEDDMTSDSEDDEEDEGDLDASIEKNNENLRSSQEKEKPTFIKPFKKRRRMQQMYYPKSRFISINNNLIFDLTVEEEFRIHNINFRRLMEYTNFVKLMKQKFQSSWEDYKKTIFVSAFSLNKVNPFFLEIHKYIIISQIHSTEFAKTSTKIRFPPPRFTWIQLSRGVTVTSRLKTTRSAQTSMKRSTMF